MGRNFLQVKIAAVPVFLHTLFMVIKLPPSPRKNCHELAFDIVSKLQRVEYIYKKTNTLYQQIREY